jgi:iron complex transport system permease protein
VKKGWIFIGLTLLAIALFLLEITWGRANVGVAEAWQWLTGSDELRAGASLILGEVRIPRALTAVLAGSGLAVSGLLMQTYFRNPLAGPSVLGISSGASVGVALLMLMVGSPALLYKTLGVAGPLAVALAASAGALLVLGIILAASRRLQDPVTLLIIGLMLGYLAGSTVSVLEFFAEEGALRRYVMWGLGSFAQVGWPALRWLMLAWLIAAAGVILVFPKLDALLLGDAYAQSLGVSVKKVRRIMLAVAGLLAGVITAFCGPIAFLGLAVPHVARFIVGTGKHKSLLPATVICGIVLALGCDLLARLPWSDQSLPLNAVTSLMGAPVVLALVLRGKKLGRLM